MDTTMHIDEKNVRECKGCARFPMARIVVSDKKSLVNDPVIIGFTYKLLKRPKLQSRQFYKVFFNLNFEIEVITYPTAINLSGVPFSSGFVVSWLSVTATTGTEWLAEPNIAVGRAIRTTPNRLTTDTLLSRCISCKIGIKSTDVLQKPLDAKNLHLERGLRPLPYTWVRGMSKRWNLIKKGTVESSRFQRGQKICRKPFEPNLNSWWSEGGPNKTPQQQQQSNPLWTQYRVWDVRRNPK